MCTRSLSRHLLVPLLVAAFVACQYVTPRSGLSGDIMRLPEDSVRTMFTAYTSSLRFSADAPLADRGIINATHDTAYIEPEIGADRLIMDQLAEGRVIARLKSRTPYPEAGLGPSWWTYWWVDGRGPGGTYRSVLVAVHDGVVFREPRGLEFRYRPDHPARSARIRPDSSCRKCGGWCAFAFAREAARAK
jgi:hypothetical protein